MTSFIASCVQLNAQDDLSANLALAETLTRRAAGEGATFIALPENAFFMQEPGKGPLPDYAATEAQFRALAQELKVWLLIGSLHPRMPSGKHVNRSLLISDTGDITAQYDKIHLFDVTLKGGEAYRESDRIEGGGEAVIAPTPWGKLGMTICYDVRFPHLYRALAHKGAQILSVPAAFTYTTGIAHWHVLLRARAIENGCFVIAPAQCGFHPGKRRTYGHSLIIGPWGEVLAEGSEAETGIIIATIDMCRVEEVRGMLPSLKHDRDYRIA